MTDKNQIIRSLTDHAKHMRELSLKMAYNCGTSSHLGGGLSIIDVLSVLYGSVMNASDKFILSKGHGVLGYYAALAEYGVITEDDLDSFLMDDSEFIAHPVMNPKKGIEASTGSLGQGISIAVGLALAAKKKNQEYNTYVIVGNGECNEGSVWEAFMSSVNYGLDNLTVFLDNNHMQSDGVSTCVMDVSDKYAGMLEALGFQTILVDGNDIAQVYDAFHIKHINGKPRIIIGNTIKGKGISFMENNPEWHHNRLTKEQYDMAMAEISKRND